MNPDTFGAWLIERLRRSLTRGGAEAKIAGQTPASGTSAGEWDAISVSYANAGLAAGTYQGTITVSALPGVADASAMDEDKPLAQIIIPI